VGELGELRSRVEQAVERLSAANDTRKRQSHGLMTLLTDLEAKYEARSEELDHCRQRIEALSTENVDLSGLIERLVVIVDTSVATEDDDALFRASAMAEDLIADWRDGPSDTLPADQADDAGEDPPIAPVEVDAALEAFAGLGLETGFEDVSPEELAAEPLDGDPAALAALLDTPISPDIEPIDSHDYGRFDELDPIQDMMAADLDIPDITLDDDEPISRIDPDEDTESSIRAMMARLEDAAARAKIGTEDATDSDADAEIDAPPAVAVGGAS
jgi:hypothetical protein